MILSSFVNLALPLTLNSGWGLNKILLKQSVSESFQSAMQKGDAEVWQLFMCPVCKTQHEAVKGNFRFSFICDTMSFLKFLFLPHVNNETISVVFMRTAELSLNVHYLPLQMCLLSAITEGSEVADLKWRTAWSELEGLSKVARKWTEPSRGSRWFAGAGWGFPHPPALHLRKCGTETHGSPQTGGCLRQWWFTDTNHNKLQAGKPVISFLSFFFILPNS